MFYIKALQCHSHINSSRIKDTNCSNYTGITLVYYLETQISVNPPTLYHRFSISNTNSMSGEWSVKLFDCFGDSGTCMQSCFSVVLAPLIHGFPILHVWFHFFCNYTGCLTCWCPCITFGRIAEIVDKGSTCRHINLSLRALVQAQKTINLVCWLSLFPACCMHGTLYVLLATIGCQWLYACTKRSSMRAQYNLQQSPCLDCCVHFFCEHKNTRSSKNAASTCPKVFLLPPNSYWKNTKTGKKKEVDVHKDRCSWLIMILIIIFLQDGKVATRWLGVYKAWNHHESKECDFRTCIAPTFALCNYEHFFFNCFLLIFIYQCFPSSTKKENKEFYVSEDWHFLFSGFLSSFPKIPKVTMPFNKGKKRHIHDLC